MGLVCFGTLSGKILIGVTCDKAAMLWPIMHRAWFILGADVELDFLGCILYGMVDSVFLRLSLGIF